ncbi:RICIN domain-containing protein [Dictyobacter arantiisoli]|uniref:Carbohydrate-binding protein n=1 Tax=Dictyobacter arantiisoli TaxID=2014874 RepID=A0A5A5TFJ3_9CHLR|nr:RICIN domain-containing protein [Dictyobacter arantiisoli]GCF10008.1 carbohydrate-binding protein [Dictyobacter arantiisoli]
MFHHRRMQLLCAVSAFLLLVTVVATQVVSTATVHAATNTSQFRGVNWADPRDNYANDPVVPSGLSTSDSYSTTYAKASTIISGFANNLGANTVRLPINPYTVNGSFWNSYTGAIDVATNKGFKVILGYWEGTGSSKDGYVDNMTSFWAMWSTVTTKYANNSQVYFEPMNEPYGYSQSAWANLAAQWISTYPSIPKNRIFVSGTGWNDNVTSVCADSRLNGTYLSLHHYGFWNTSQTSYSGWVSDLENRIGSCASRTVVDEWGAPMTTGLDYNGAINGNYFIAYVQADTDTFRSLGLGSVYWPGLRTGDTYSMETLNGSGTNLSLSDNNASGVVRLKYAFGLISSPGGTTYYKLVNRNSGKVLDVVGASTADGANVDQWADNGGANQQWSLVSTGSYYKLVNRGSGKVLDVASASTADGGNVDQWTDNGGTNQQWSEVNSGGYITLVNRNSGKDLEVSGYSTADGGNVDQWTSNGGSNQQWTLVQVS